MRYLLAACFAGLAVLSAHQATTASASDLELRALRDPEHAADWHRRALDADPRLSSAWIALGLDAERLHRIEEARSDLLQAASVDRQYTPAWTLAGFYFRQNDRSNFWPWARRAADLAYDDLRPLLQLAHAVEPDASAVLQNLGASDRLLRADLDYLVSETRWADAQYAARLILSRSRPDDRPRVLETADRQLRAGNIAYALELWNAFYPALDPESGRILTNGQFDHAPSNRGFDWRLPPAHGIAIDWTPGALNFSFDGDQCEDCAILEQTVPLAPHARAYRLRCEAHLDWLASPSGLRWDFGGRESSPVSSGVQEFSFPAPAGDFTSLRLIYRREPGTTRARGLVQLRDLRLEPLPRKGTL